MNFNPLPLAGSYIIEIEPFSDERGWFARTYCKEEFGKIGHTKEWLQINHSFTRQKGTIRGMHFQHQPYSEIKVVRCIAGAVYDVIVDVRAGSPTFLQWVGVEISAANKKMIYIPAGFAHGFQSLEDNAELIYHHSSFYKPGAEGGVRFDDEALAIQWPMPVTSISERDQQHALINQSFKGIKI